MDIESINNQNSSDVSGLKPLEFNKNTQEIAQQFDAVFLQSMQKSMSIENHFMKPEPFQYNSEPVAPSSIPGNHLSKTYLTKLSQSSDADTASILFSEHAAASSSGCYKSVGDFVKSVWPYARQVASLIGLDPGVLIAQAALETGWGQHIAQDSNGSSNNLFNIKSSQKNSNSVETKTTEFLHNSSVNTLASFKKYPSVEESFMDYVALIQSNPRYQKALEKTYDAEGYMQELQKAGYATDPHYANKILAIYHGMELQRALASFENKTSDA